MSLEYEYLVISATLSETYWEHLAATRIPVDYEEACRQQRRVKDEYPDNEYIIVRRPKSAPWERA